VDCIDSQSVALQTLSRDISEIKETLKQLANIATTQALQSQRIEIAEGKILKIETVLDRHQESIYGIERRCLEREPVVKYGRHRMEHPDSTHDDWWSMFIGSAVRNGVWIVGTGVLVSVITYLLGVKK